jgi:small ligand-binding sensory domain FIST
MKWVSTISQQANLALAVREAATRVSSGLDGREPDLVMAFVSDEHAEAYDRVPELVARELPHRVLVGCSAGSVIGGGREVEDQPALSLIAAVLPDVKLSPFHLDSEAIPDPALGADAWSSLLGLSQPEAPELLLLPDPFTFEAERALAGLDASFPRANKLGGVASGGRRPGENALYLGPRVHRSGLVGLALQGNVVLDTIVAQGCRPIGVPLFVTRCRGNLLLEVDGRAPIEVLQELYREASAADQELFRTSLFLGIEMREARNEYQQGDFLIRNIVGIDQKSGAVAIGAMLHDAQVVQFHLRDAATSAEDLERRLSGYASGRGVATIERRGAGFGTAGLVSNAPEGALLFSCLGRGTYLYGRPDHDSEVFRRLIGDVPLAGFFCNGEIGPVEGTTFLHGYTSAFGIFRRRT